jgi:rhamnosyltransferase
MKTQYPKIAVLLAAYNGKKWIEEQMNSILNQENVAATIYVSVDFSMDSTHEFVEELALTHKNINVLPYGDRYGGAAPNFFRLIKDVDFSSYDYISLADQDDIWNSYKLSSACRVLALGEFSAYSGNVTAFWDDGSEKVIDKAQPQVKYDYLFESAGPGCTFVFSKVFALELKNQLVRLGSETKNIWLHDWFAYSFSRENGYKWFVDKKPLMNYRQHSDNQIGSNIGFGATFKRVKVILSGDGFKKVIAQADSLNQKQLVPIKLLKINTRLSFLRLAVLFRQCRRRPIEQFSFFIICILMAIKGPVDYD